jgi:CheY-like chemotaxis protein
MPGHVLIVDDDKDIVTVLTAILEEEQYAVTHAYAGHEALEAVDRSIPDLILMDYMLPDLNGDQVALKIREKITAHVPMILISAAHNAEKIAHEAQFDGYLPKPFEIDHLLSEITRHLTA